MNNRLAVRELLSNIIKPRTIIGMPTGGGKGVRANPTATSNQPSPINNQRRIGMAQANTGRERFKVPPHNVGPRPDTVFLWTITFAAPAHWSRFAQQHNCPLILFRSIVLMDLSHDKLITITPAPAGPGLLSRRYAD